MPENRNTGEGRSHFGLRRRERKWEEIDDHKGVTMIEGPKKKKCTTNTAKHKAGKRRTLIMNQTSPTHRQQLACVTDNSSSLSDKRPISDPALSETRRRRY